MITDNKIVPNSIVYSDTFSAYDLLDVSELKRYQINRSKLFASKTTQINGIDNFWNQAKRHLRRFNDIPNQNVPFFLKKGDWSFSNPDHKL